MLVRKWRNWQHQKLLWEYKMAQQLRKVFWQILRIQPSKVQKIPLLCMHLKENVSTQSRAWMFLAAVSNRKTWKQGKAINWKSVKPVVVTQWSITRQQRYTTDVLKVSLKWKKPATKHHIVYFYLYARMVNSAEIGSGCLVGRWEVQRNREWLIGVSLWDNKHVSQRWP